MPADASIYSLVKPAEQPNALQEAAYASQLQQGNLKALDLAQTIGRQNALQRVLQAGGRAEDLRNAGFLDESLKVEKADLDRRKTDADILQSTASARNQQAQMNGHHWKFMGDLAHLVVADPRPETVASVLDQWEGVTGMKADPTRQAFATAKTPDEIRQLALRINLEAKDQLPKVETRNTGGSTDTLAIDPLTGKPTVTSTVRNTMTPGEAARLRQAEDHFQAGQNAPEYKQGEDGAWYALPKKPGSGPITAAPVTGPDGKPFAGGSKAPPAFTGAMTGINELRLALQAYETALDEVGGPNMAATGESRAKLQSAYTALKMGLKNAFELGALTGPDVGVLEGMLADPTGMKTLVLGSDGFKGQITGARGYLKNREAALETTYGRKNPAAKQAASGATAGQAFADSGKEARYQEWKRKQQEAK